MDCRTVQTELLNTDATVGADVRDHVRGCDNCRAYADLHSLLMDTPMETEPRPDLDRAVLTQARTRLRENARRSESRQPVPLVFSSARVKAYCWAAAAVFVVGLFVLVFMQDETAVGTGATSPLQAMVEVRSTTAPELDDDLLVLETVVVFFDSDVKTLFATDTDQMSVDNSSAATAARVTIDDKMLALETELYLETELFGDSPWG